MKKKTIALCGLVTVAGLSLASCGGSKEDPSKRLDIYLNYQGESGVTYQGTNPYVNAIDGTTYTTGALLPTWNAFAKNLDLNIKEATSYSAKNNDDAYKAVNATKYESEVQSGQKIDLFMNSSANINKMGNAGEAVDLNQHLDEMPNFKAWLAKNPTIAKQITVDGKIFYTPYFDGYNDIERMFVMNTEYTKKVLDAANFNDFDTTVSGKGAAANALQEAKYQPFIHAENNYAEDTKVKVLNGDKVEEITVKKTTNIIKQQNELLANGATGKQLAEQFNTYLKAAYGEYIGAGKIYENVSDIFVSEAAAYNVDEMIALFRVVKANPKLITGDATKEVEIFTPRGAANNRVDNMADIMQIWGVNGMVSEKEMLYYTPSGELADAATTQATYDALKNLSAIYSEGLIIGDFWLSNSTVKGGTYYLDKYFGKTTDNLYALMLYDYSASTGAVNDKVDGIGTDASKRSVAGTTVQGVMPILPPLTYWATEATWKVDQALSDFTGKSLIRFAGENRGLKDGSWCIPTTSDNIAGALKLMDYLFGPEGSKIQDFGPEEYWAEVSSTIVPGEQTPVFSRELKAMIGASGTDFWSFMREYIGSTHGIGCVRSKGLDIQATNVYAQIGLTNLKQAIAAGVVNSSLFDKYEGGKLSWDSSVPSAGYPAINKETQAKYAAISAFWSSDKAAESKKGWVSYITVDGCAADTLVLGKDASANQDYTFAMVKEQIAVKNTNYLNTYKEAFKK